MMITLRQIGSYEMVTCNSVMVASMILGVMAKDLALGVKGNGFVVNGIYGIQLGGSK